jgi:hypothetical protein
VIWIKENNGRTFTETPWIVASPRPIKAAAKRLTDKLVRLGLKPELSRPALFTQGNRFEAPLAGTLGISLNARFRGHLG